MSAFPESDEYEQADQPRSADGTGAATGTDTCLHRHGVSRNHRHHHRHHHHYRKQNPAIDSFSTTPSLLGQAKSPQTAFPAFQSGTGRSEDSTLTRSQHYQDTLAVPGQRSTLESGSTRYGTPAPAYSTNPHSGKNTPIYRPLSPSGRPSLDKSASEPIADIGRAYSTSTSSDTHHSQTSLSNVPYLPSRINITCQNNLTPGARVHWMSSRTPTAVTDCSTNGNARTHSHPSSHQQIPTNLDRSPLHGQHNHNAHSSWLQDGLPGRDQRLSFMFEDCLGPQTYAPNAFGSNAVRQSAASGDLRRRKRSSFLESVLGMDNLNPQDLVNNEGAVVDGGFFSMAPGLYGRGSILVDGRRNSNDSMATNASRSSRFANFFKRGGVRPIDHNGSEPRGTTLSSASLNQSTFPMEQLKPRTLQDRITSSNLRPPKLDLERNSRSNTASKTPSRLRESVTVVSASPEAMNVSSRGWHEIHLESACRNNKQAGKNDKIAQMLGVQRTNESGNDYRNLQDSEETKERKDLYNDDLEKQDYRDSYASSFRNTTSSFSVPTMSQADVIAICLMQGMVPPGLPSDPNLVTWSSPQSPTNPRNWSLFHKWYACILISLLTFMANAGTNMLAPAFGLLSQTWSDVYNPVKRGLLIGCYVFAFTFAPIVFGPMSEVMGRRPVILLGILLFFVFNLCSAWVPNPYVMMLFRFFAALGASAPMAIGGAILTDIFPPEKRTGAMTVFALAPQLGPVLGPVMAGWVVQELRKWRWIYYFSSIALAVIGVPCLFIRESYTPRILAKRAAKLRKETGNKELKTIFERRKESIGQIFSRGAVRPFVLFSVEPILIMLTVYISLIYGLFHLTTATFPAVFGTIYNDRPGWASMHFICIGVGTISGGIIGGLLVEHHYKVLSFRNGGVAKPEYRLFAMLYFVWLPPLGLSTYGWCTFYGIHWIFADVGIVTFCFGISAAVVSIQTYLVDSYALLAGSALTAAIVFRSIAGTGATIGAEDLLLHAGLAWSNVSLSLACVVIGVPVFFYLYFRGAMLREKSKHATHKR